MITKEQWESIRNMEEIPLYVWYEYYRENGGTIEDLGVFENTFHKIMAQQPLVITRKGPVRLSFDSAVNRIYDYYYNKFPE